MTAIEFNNQCNNLNSLLYGFAMRLTCDREKAKDLMQETMMRAYASLNNFTDGTNFKAWMTTIMRNCFINDYRKLRTRNRVEHPLENNISAAMKQPVTNQAAGIIMMKELRSMLDHLSDEHRIPFEMFFNGYEYQEIAEEMDIPMGTVKSRIFFARKKLKDMIQGQYGENVRAA